MKERSEVIPLNIAISLCIVFGTWVNVTAQGICVPDKLSVEAVRGKVMSHSQRERPIVDATVSLLEDRYQGRVIAQTTTDASGKYALKDVKPGTYMLKVAAAHLVAFYVRVTVARNRPSTHAAPQQELVILMGAAFTEPCAGSVAVLRELNDN